MFDYGFLLTGKELMRSKSLVFQKYFLFSFMVLLFKNASTKRKKLEDEDFEDFLFVCARLELLHINV